jgi:D-serine deaminase-like pyridoxal phosphate-dependent protein
MAAAGMGADLLLANETLDPRRLRAMADTDAHVTVAVDSDATVDAAATNGIREVLVDVNVGLPRCGIAPEQAGGLADRARAKGLTVRGVMGYEGHLMMPADPATGLPARPGRRADLLLAAHADVGGGVVAGGTGTYDLHDRVTEVQAGSYALMDSAYAALGLPFRQGLFLETTVISVSPQWAVCDAGLKSLAFERLDPERFPCLGLAHAALRAGGTAPAVLNAANEVAVEAFLAGGLPFPGIADVVERVLGQIEVAPVASVEQVLDTDRLARRMAGDAVAVAA